MRLINQLPDNYKKTKDSSNYKLLELAQKSLDEFQKVLTDIENIRDIDTAYGVNLDRTGKNVLEYRGKREEETFRKFIKIKIKAMRSSGDIPTLNDLFTSILEGDYQGLTESWDDEDFHEEPAAMIGDIKSTSSEYLGVFDEYLVAGGVKLIWRMLLTDSIIKILSFMRKGFWQYPLCNMIDTGHWPYLLNDGKLKRSFIKIITEELERTFIYPETAKIKASNYFYAVHQFADQKNVYRDILNLIKIKDADIEYLKADETLSGLHPYTQNRGKIKRTSTSLEQFLKSQYVEYQEISLIAASEKLYQEYQFVSQKEILKNILASIAIDSSDVSFIRANEKNSGVYPYIITDGKLIAEILELKEDLGVGHAEYAQTGLIITSEELKVLYEFAKQKSINLYTMANENIELVDLNYGLVNEIASGNYPELHQVLKQIRDTTGLTDHATTNEMNYPLCNQIQTKKE